VIVAVPVLLQGFADAIRYVLFDSGSFNDGEYARQKLDQRFHAG
jgi:hypothetical protein